MVLQSLPQVLLRHMKRIGLAGFSDAIESTVSSVPQATLHRMASPEAADETLDGILVNAAGLARGELTLWARTLWDRQCLYLLHGCEDSPADDWGMVRYYRWRMSEGGALALDSERLPAPGGACLSLYFRASYDPVCHARELFSSGNPAASLELLENVPEHVLLTDEMKGLAAAEHLLPLLVWDQVKGEEERVNRLATALDDFYKATTYLPGLRMAYDCMAMMWGRVGHASRGAGLVRTAAFAAGEVLAAVPLDEQGRQESAKDEIVQRILPGAGPIPRETLKENSPLEGGTVRDEAECNSAIPGGTVRAAGEGDESGAWYPEIDVRPALAEGPVRLLYLSHVESDYGGDLLFNGLCELLGDENVVDFPWKPMLHGELLEAAEGYPCTFHRPGSALPVEAVAEQLAAGKFDAILLNDTLGGLDQQIVDLVFQYGAATPAFVLDMWDQCGDYYGDVCARAGIRHPVGYLKRELIIGAQYNLAATPLPFSYAESQIPAEVTYAGRSGLFWAGKPVYGDRRVKLEWLAANRGLEIGRKLSQAAYQEAMRTSLMGLCLFGNGFDTVRYWELPAHGVMLLAERPPIVIPNNFVDAKHAVFFDDLPELVEKLDYYLAHPAEATAIARAGRDHLRRWHTDVVRAEQLLRVVLASVHGGQAARGEYGR